jgi:multiple sugar transport system substrate-binding protein
MAATARRFSELHPHVTIVWEKHSLKTFEESPVARLAADYDLMVLDHPCVAKAAPGGALLPLDEHLSSDFLNDQAAQSVGESHASYQSAGHQWALAIDAAAPIAFWRADLLTHLDTPVPQTWAEVIALARLGRVEIPAAPINCLMNFYTLCFTEGGRPFAASGNFVSRPVALAAFARLRELLTLCDSGCWTRNPIASHELVSSAANERLVYCPLAYGYSNYARNGFGDRPLDSGETPLVNGQPLRTTLGGAGLGISASRTENRRETLAYAGFVASGQIQRTLYTQSGGQPGYREAWLDSGNNLETRNYFSRTLSVLDRAFVRPQFPGYMNFQEQGAPILHAALRGALPVDEALDQLDRLHRDSLLLTSAAA